MSVKCHIILISVLILNGSVNIYASADVKFNLHDLNVDAGEDLLHRESPEELSPSDDDQFSTSAVNLFRGETFEEPISVPFRKSSAPDNRTLFEVTPEARSGALIRLNQPYFGELGFDVFNDDANTYNWGKR